MAAPASGSQPSAGLTPEEQLAYIQVNQTGLARLALFLPEMTKHVRHICLNIQLNPYDCRICQETESTPWSFINDKIIADAIVELFDILSSWEERPGGLMLELNAFSPSDKTHWLKHAFVGAPGEVVPAQYARPTVHDPQHGWEHDRMVRPPCGDALRRPFQTSYLYFGSELATVPAVTKFLLRRQCRRQLEPWSVIQLFDKLPKLEDIQYEPWQLFKRSSQTPWDFGKRLKHTCPSPYAGACKPCTNQPFTL